MKAQTDTNSHYSIENTKSQSALPTTLAKYLRILGALALLGSGILYMFQGLDNIDMNMRNWVYLALISCLGAGGIFSFKLTQDRKGARLFFGLAAILVPVQFSQLGGIIYSYLGGGSGSLNSIFQFSETSISAIVVLTAISFIISAIIIYLAFYILARGQEKLLAILYLLINVAILIPLREFPLGLLTLALLAIAVISIEKNIFNKSPVFKTLEGFSIRVMFTFPLLIAFIRSGFHQNESLGLSLLLIVFAISLLKMLHYWCADGRLKESFVVLSYMLGVLAIPGIADSLYSSVSQTSLLPSDLKIFSYYLPFLAWTLSVSYVSISLRPLYRLAVVIALLMLNFQVILDAKALSLVLSCLSGIACLFWGIAIKAKLPTIVGIFVGVLSFAGILFLSLVDTSVNFWLALAIIGLLFVAFSSVLEKYGKRWALASRENFGEFSAWSYQ